MQTKFLQPHSHQRGWMLCTCVRQTHKQLGGFDRNLSMCNQVHRVVRSAYFHLCSIGLTQKMLTVAATKQLVQALVISRLDYCNSLLTGIPTSLMSRLEMVQHRAARLIFRSSGHQSVTVLMKDLHWLPVTSRVLFKVLVLV